VKGEIMPIITEALGSVWVLWWQPSDGAGNSDIKRAYEEERRANADYNLVKDHPIRNYFLDNVLFYKSLSAIPEGIEEIVDVWILWWQSSDGIGSSCIERTYEEEKRANEDFVLVEDHPTRNYFLDNILLYKRPTGIDN
jgi:hypothetical protein